MSMNELEPEVPNTPSQPCNHPGCEAGGLPCYTHGSDLEEDPAEYLCPAHMYQHGYCSGCHLFWAGVESFDCSKLHLCSECEGELRAELELEDSLEDYENPYWFEGSGPGDFYYDETYFVSAQADEDVL